MTAGFHVLCEKPVAMNMKELEEIIAISDKTGKKFTVHQPRRFDRDYLMLKEVIADACLKATPIENSQLGEHLAKPDWHCHHDHFKDSNPNIEWQATLDQAEKIGLGTRQYELKIVK